MPGDVFSDFQIEARIGSGQMGIVYRVRRLPMDRTEALKVIAPMYAEDGAFRVRFMREATHAALAANPHVVTVYDANERDGRLYMAMQYVDGADLSKRIATAGSLPSVRAAEITRQVGSALDAAHRVGLVHRDVKPANILVAEHQGVDHAYLSDFGVSRRVATSDDLTQPGSFVGAPYYAAPEQHEGEPVDARTDVYSLGCVLFEMLTGRVPFPGTTATAVAIAHCSEPPPRPTALDPDLPMGFDGVIAKAMAKAPDDRFQTAGELGAAAVAAAATVEDETPADAAPQSPLPDPGEAATAIVGAVEVERPADPTPDPTPEPTPKDRSQAGGRKPVAAIVLGILAIAAAVAIVVVLAGGSAGGISATARTGANVRSAPAVSRGNVAGGIARHQHVTVSCWVKGSGSRHGWDRLQSPHGGDYVAAGLLRPLIRSPAC